MRSLKEQLKRTEKKLSQTSADAGEKVDTRRIADFERLLAEAEANARGMQEEASEAEAKAQAQREHAARISALATPKPHARPGTAEPPRTAVRDRPSSGKKQIRLFTASPASPAAPRTPGYQQPRSQETRSALA